MRPVLLLLCVALLLTNLSGEARGAKFNRVLDVGDAAPAWRDLPGIDGKKHSLADQKESPLVVVIFLRNNCPVAQTYEARIRQLTKDYAERGVAVVAINVSRRPGESLEDMRERARQQEFNFTYLRDESQQTARDYGATVTPHAFILDRERKIAYMGAIDDSNDPEHVEEPFVRHALDALLTGEEIEVEETLQRGCAIDFES